MIRWEPEPSRELSPDERDEWLREDPAGYFAARKAQTRAMVVREAAAAEEWRRRRVRARRAARLRRLVGLLRWWR